MKNVIKKHSIMEYINETFLRDFERTHAHAGSWNSTLQQLMVNGPLLPTWGGVQPETIPEHGGSEVVGGSPGSIATTWAHLKIVASSVHDWEASQQDKVKNTWVRAILTYAPLVPYQDSWKQPQNWVTLEVRGLGASNLS